MLHLQGGGDQLSYPGEAQEAEDLHEPEELLPASLLVAVVGGGPDDVPGVEEEEEVGELDDDDDTLLVDKGWGGKV